MNKSLERLVRELKLPIIPTVILLVLTPIYWIPSVHIFMHDVLLCQIIWFQGKSTPVVLSLLTINIYLFVAHLNNAFRKNPRLHCPMFGQYTFKPLPIGNGELDFIFNNKSSKKRCESCGHTDTVRHEEKF